MPKESSELQVKLKKADAMVRGYVAELKARNEKRQRDIIKLEADKDELNGRIKALEQQLKEKKVDFRLNINVPRDPRDELTEEQILPRLKALAPRLIEWAPKLGLKIEPLA